MAFISNGSNVISFAEYQDVFDADQRIFDLNEGLTDDVIETSLVRATERILTRVRSTDWWKGYYLQRDTSTTQVVDIPAPSANKIVDRRNDFTELCVAVAMSEYILPKIADFGAADNAEKNKMGYYLQRADKIFAELITAGDWYDFDGSGVVASVEKQATHVNLRRIR